MIKSPIYFDVRRGVNIDLSQLAEVGPIFGYPVSSEHIYRPNDPAYFVGFQYRFASSTEWLHYRRPLREGPRRFQDLTLVDPSAHLKCVGEEYYEVVSPSPKHPSLKEHKGYVLVHHEKTGELQVVRNLQAERNRLVNAWTKWKKIEPEIYAIIRKHLG